jgi:DNA-directed RNA polymerase subunit L
MGPEAGVLPPARETRDPRYLYRRFPPIYKWMNIKILELQKDLVKIVILGEGHTFMNALTEEILRDPDVDVAKYLIKFQFSDPELLVTTNGKKDPLVVITEACRRISGSCDELLAGVRARKQ